MLQQQINQIPKSRIKADLVIGFMLCLCILLALSGLYLWKTDIYKKQFNTLIEQQQSLSLCGRISLPIAILTVAALTASASFLVGGLTRKGIVSLIAKHCYIQDFPTLGLAQK